MSERPNRKQIKRIRPLHRQAKEEKPQLSPNARLLDDSPVRRYSSRQKNSLFKISHTDGLLALGDVRDQVIDLRAVIATAAIELVIELP